jgi:hypothetical protein
MFSSSPETLVTHSADWTAAADHHRIVLITAFGLVKNDYDGLGVWDSN